MLEEYLFRVVYMMREEKEYKILHGPCIQEPELIHVKQLKTIKR